MPSDGQTFSRKRVAPMPPGLLAEGLIAPENWRHLRITLELEGGRARVLSTHLVEEPLVQAPYTLGQFVYQVSVGGRPLWVDTQADPTVERGIARPGEREHSFQPDPRPMVVMRVPVAGNDVPDDVTVYLFRATEGVPQDVATLARTLAVAERIPRSFERIATIELTDLRRRVSAGHAQ